MPFRADIVVCSNLHKEVAEGVELIVGLPSKDPWSLPFVHKHIFAERIDRYDLFIYSEDDVLITERNLEAFLEVSQVLSAEEIAGFLRIEKAADGTVYYPEVHHRFHWIPSSVRRRGQFILASFSNQHSACYILTKQHLRRAIRSGGFLVGPHHSKYDLLCSAATDPYTQCGFTKLVCISHLDSFLVHHLPNKYLDKLGTVSADVNRQIDSLLSVAAKGTSGHSLFETEPSSLRLPYSTYYCKDYYEPVRRDIVSLITADVGDVLSIGCGWGATEEALASRGMRVIAIPLDPVIGACARARGIEVIDAAFDALPVALAGQRFSCILLSNTLHLIDAPDSLLRSLRTFLTDGGRIVAIVPNVRWIRSIWQELRHDGVFSGSHKCLRPAVHNTSPRVLRSWFHSAGLRINKLLPVFHHQRESTGHMLGGLTPPLFASELVAIASVS